MSPSASPPPREQRTRTTTTPLRSSEKQTEEIEAQLSPEQQNAECQQTCLSECAADAFECPKQCRSDNECDADQLCMGTRAGPDGKWYMRCLRSECGPASEEPNCPVGYKCEYSGRMEGGVFRCILLGLRTLGDACSRSIETTQTLCADGLKCSRGICGPEHCEEHSDCGLGWACWEVAGGDGHRTCTPWCENDSECPIGKQCATLTNASLCIDDANKSCRSTGCPDGQFCHDDHTDAWNFVATCATECSPDEESCADGAFCAPSSFFNRDTAAFRCYQNCSVPGNECMEGWHCTEHSPDESYCVFDNTMATKRHFELE